MTSLWRRQQSNARQYLLAASHTMDGVTELTKPVQMQQRTHVHLDHAHQNVRSFHISTNCAQTVLLHRYALDLSLDVVVNISEVHHRHSFPFYSQFRLNMGGNVEELCTRLHALLAMNYESHAYCFASTCRGKDGQEERLVRVYWPQIRVNENTAYRLSRALYEYARTFFPHELGHNAVDLQMYSHPLPMIGGERILEMPCETCGNSTTKRDQCKDCNYTGIQLCACEVYPLQLCTVINANGNRDDALCERLALPDTSQQQRMETASWDAKRARPDDVRNMLLEISVRALNVPKLYVDVRDRMLAYLPPASVLACINKECQLKPLAHRFTCACGSRVSRPAPGRSKKKIRHDLEEDSDVFRTIQNLVCGTQEANLLNGFLYGHLRHAPLVPPPTWCNLPDLDFIVKSHHVQQREKKLRHHIEELRSKYTLSETSSAPGTTCKMPEDVEARFNSMRAALHDHYHRIPEHKPTDVEACVDHMRAVLHDSRTNVHAKHNLLHVWKHCRVDKVYSITRQGHSSPDKYVATLAGLGCAWCPFHRTTHPHGALEIEITSEGCSLHCKDEDSGPTRGDIIKTPMFVQVSRQLFEPTAKVKPLAMDDERWGLRTPREDFGKFILDTFMPRRGIKRPRDHL